MAEVFVDASGWASAFIRTQPYHAEAKRLLHDWQHQKINVVTTNYVVVELISPLRIHHAHRVQSIDIIRTSPWIEVVHVDPHLDDQAGSVLKQRSDKNWSLADSVSFAVMKHRGIVEALTSDHHFEQAGFVRLLK